MSIENPFDAVRQAVRDARLLNDAVDAQANAMVDLLTGRLRKVSPYRLKELKAALRDFDAGKREWKQP